MTDGLGDRMDHKQALSALADGELDAQAAGRLCAAWRDEAGLQSAWRNWHLIGDVLRSEDLASDGAHDERFLARLRERMVQEPVVLAPQASAPIAPPAAPARRAWTAPFAVAAGFMAVAGVLVATRMTGPGEPGVALNPQAGPIVAARVDPTELPTEVNMGDTNVAFIRDAHLDRYLAAHRQFGNAIAVPGAGLRNAAAIVPER